MESKRDTHNALDQYRQLLEDYSQQVSDHTATPIAEVRESAAKLFLSHPSVDLPSRGAEGYKYTDLREMFSPDLGVNIMRYPVNTDIETAFHCGLPAISSLLGITVNDTFRLTERLERLLPSGVTVTSFSKASGQAAEIISRYYGKIATSSTDNVATLMNTSLAQDGILVHVSKGVKTEKPLQLVNILQSLTTPDGKEMPILAIRRLLVVLEAHSNLSIVVCDHDRTEDGVSGSTRINEIVVGEDAELNLYELEETSGCSCRYVNTVARQGKNSRLTLFSGTLKPGRTRNDYQIHLDGTGATLRLDGMCIVNGNQTGDNSTEVLHHVPHCHSHQTFKYLAGDNARGAFEGLIRVDHGAMGTEAYQTNNNLLASPGARMHTEPQLEIYCDDVKCSHGAATGQLDEEALFYMRSRGIDLPEARVMLMNAFMSDVIENIKLTPLRDRLKHLVERRLSGDDARCQGCNLPTGQNQLETQDV